MRTYLGLASAFLILGMAGVQSNCASDLWNNYVRDSEDSCVRVGCTGGGTCNPNTGFCEGGSSGVDAGVDMTPSTRGDLFKDPVAIKTNQPIVSTNLLQMATMTPSSGNDLPEIWLSDPTRNMTRLVPSGELNYLLTLNTVGEQPCFLTSILSQANGKRDLLVGTLGMQYLRATGGGGATSPRAVSLPGFKLMSIGDLNSDGLPDMIVTSSMLRQGTATYGGGADGNAVVFLGNNNYGLDAQTGSSIGQKLVSANLQHQPGKETSGFNIALIGSDRPTVAILELVTASGGSISVGNRFEVPIPASDLAIPVDLDNDGSSDLVVAQLWDGKTDFSGDRGSVHVVQNTGSTGSPNFEKQPAQGLSIASGVVLGVHVADFDLDGLPDLTVLISSGTDHFFAMFRNEASQNNQQQRQLRPFDRVAVPYPPRAVEYTDVNSDGCKDMVMLASGRVAAAAADGTSIQVALGKKRGGGQPDCN